jgi:hypothetical protein
MSWKRLNIFCFYKQALLIIEEYNTRIMVNSEESISNTAYLTLQTRCRINRCCHSDSCGTLENKKVGKFFTWSDDNFLYNSLTFGTGVLYLNQINHQPDATIFQFIILTFVYSSTCFGRFPAHHQELNDCSGSLWFYLCIVMTVVLLLVVRPAGLTTNKITKGKHITY